MAAAVKFADGSDTVLEILAIPFGGPINGRDTDGEFFSAKTDLCLDWFPSQIPLLYHHGLDDAGPGVSVVGRVDRTTARKTDEGWWVQAQLDASNAYHARIKRLIERQALYGSSGAMPHLVTASKSGEITRWPWVEESLTPTPANPFSTVEPSEVVKHFKTARLDLKAVLDAEALGKLSDTSFAYIDQDGGRHLPIHDAAHVRAALSRFDQTDFEDDAAKQSAAKKVLAAAKKFGVDVADDSAVAEASKRLKATNDAIPATGDDGDAPEGSAEDWIEDLNRLLNANLGGPFGSSYAYTVATFGVNGPGYAVVCVCDAGGDQDMAYYRVEFGPGENGEPVLGPVTPLDQVYIPAKTSGMDSAEPLLLAIGTAINRATVVSQRTKDLAGRRLKEGRMLSSANVERLQALQKTLSSAATDIEDLLRGAQPPAKAMVDPALLRLLELRTRQHQVGRTA